MSRILRVKIIPNSRLVPTKDNPDPSAEVDGLVLDLPDDAVIELKKELDGAVGCIRSGESGNPEAVWVFHLFVEKFSDQGEMKEALDALRIAREYVQRGCGDANCGACERIVNDQNRIDAVLKKYGGTDGTTAGT